MSGAFLFHGGSVRCAHISGSGAAVGYDGGITDVPRSTGIEAGTPSEVVVNASVGGRLSSEAQLLPLRGGLGLPAGQSAANGWSQIDQTLGGLSEGIVPAIVAAAPHSAFSALGVAAAPLPNTLVLRDGSGNVSIALGYPLLFHTADYYHTITGGVCDDQRRHANATADTGDEGCHIRCQFI